LTLAIAKILSPGAGWHFLLIALAVMCSFINCSLEMGQIVFYLIVVMTVDLLSLSLSYQGSEQPALNGGGLLLMAEANFTLRL
jgi:hypothetical protein